MKKYLKVAIPMILVLILLVSVSALAAGNVSLNFSELGAGLDSSPITQAAGTTWRVKIDTISNHGVGIVFLSDKYTWASSLYTYSSSTMGLRPYRPYSSNAPDGTDVYWRMRLDNDYSGSFSCSGEFQP